MRIVKNISSANFTYHYSSKKEQIIDGQAWKRLQLETRPIYLHEIPKEAFVEVYIGENCYRDQRKKQQNRTQRPVDSVDSIDVLKAHCRSSKAVLHRVDVDIESWSLRKHEII